MVDDVLDLQLVLVVGVRVGEISKLLGQLEAVRHVLRRDKVLGHFDAVVQVAHLVGGAGGYEHGVTEALHDRVAAHVVLVEEAAAQHLVQVEALVVDGVVARVKCIALFLFNLNTQSIKMFINTKRALIMTNIEYVPLSIIFWKFHYISL